MFFTQFEAIANAREALIRERLGTDYKIYLTARCAGGTEERRIEKTEMYEISSNLRFRIISYTVLLEGERRKTLFSLPYSTAMEREAVGDWISFQRFHLLCVSSEASGEFLGALLP